MENRKARPLSVTSCVYYGRTNLPIIPQKYCERVASTEPTIFRDEFITLGIRFFFFRFLVVRRQPMMGECLVSSCPTSPMIMFGCRLLNALSLRRNFISLLSSFPCLPYLPTPCVARCVMNIKWIYVNQSKSHFSCYLCVVTFEPTLLASMSPLQIFSSLHSIARFFLSFSRPKVSNFRKSIPLSLVIFQLFSSSGRSTKRMTHSATSIVASALLLQTISLNDFFFFSSPSHSVTPCAGEQPFVLVCEICRNADARNIFST